MHVHRRRHIKATCGFLAITKQAFTVEAAATARIVRARPARNIVGRQHIPERFLHGGLLFSAKRGAC